jgi:hypothetical protein
MKELGLQELLRYALSGGVGIASLLLMYPNLACLVGHVNGAADTTLILGAILVFGTMIYNIHRGLLFPPIFRCIGLKTLYKTKTLHKTKPNYGCPFKPSKREIEVDRWRWERKEEDRRRWDNWGAQTHFLYCAAWAIFVAFWIGLIEERHLPCWRPWLICGLLFCISLIAGCVNNYRLLYSINAEMQREKEDYIALTR